MEYWPLNLTVISAKDLKDVNFFRKMNVYAIVTLSNNPRFNHKTPVDKEGGKSPTWNFPMKFAIPTGHANSLVLYIQLMSDRSLGDREIGEVHIPIKELLASDGQAAQFVSYQVRTPSGKPRGVLNLSYKFDKKVVSPGLPPLPQKSDETVTAYPAAVPGQSSAGAYPPPASAYPYPSPPTYPAAGYGYGAPPPQPAYGYGYPPPPRQGYGYGYPPPPMVAPPPKKPKNNLGMGLGAGLLGGALGGLLIGDMISDSTDAYDAGYDAGLDDGGGFDF